ncbi:MAG: DUF4010 domain-containing protein [Gemmatimonadetes bacterium]|nr:DUF4010 domain-containing protein [Gemmatimonadota bacterium]
MPPLALDLLVATLVGMAVGVEREWSGHTTGPDARFAGVRTFALLGALGGFAGWLLRDGQPVAGAVLVAAGVLFPMVAYAVTLRRPDTTTDGTTEVVAMVVVALGVTAGLGHRAAASAAGVLAVLLLAEKSAMQAALQRVAATELRAALQFGVLALVILPVLPDRSFGPFGAFNPRELWVVVLLFSGLNFAGYLARRAVGETRGLGITGMLGGVVSSTAVTLTFSRRSRDDPALGEALAVGVLGACTVLIPRLLVVTSLLNAPVARALLPVLAPPLLAGVALVAVAYWRDHQVRATEAPASAVAARGALEHNPLALGSALQMAVAFQLVLFAIAWVQAHVGATGVLASATLLGLTDMDALTLSMTRYGVGAQVPVAALAIGVGVLTNTGLKLALAATVGRGRYRLQAVGGLAVLGLATGAALWAAWR